ncbi:Lrp/AsnC family transcriptional regulator [Marinomonas agarivorans]|nr:Lrp/AsnC family transcriptional regulator [Marinomonas agarivorans]
MKKNFKNDNRYIDAIDKQLIELLNQNARTSVTELAKQVKMTAPSVNERLRKLEETGVISGYHVDINPERLGYTLVAIVRIRHHPGKAKELEHLINLIPECVECDKVTGDDCYIARLYLQNISQLDPILEEIASIAETNTAIVKSTPIKRRLISI